jgi:hypothetical protein
MTVLVEIPLELRGGMNSRDAHWRARQRRVKNEREQTAWALFGKKKPATPCLIRITRIAPSAGLDDDNLRSACKGVRDAFAEWIGVDDRRSDVVAYDYDQLRGAWGVRIEQIEDAHDF